MTCPICEKQDWHHLGDIHSKGTLQVCKGCGFIAHAVKVEEEDRLLAFYKTQYRDIPNHVNLITTTNKLQYIAKFLQDFLKDKKGLMVGDIGAATGYFLNDMRKRGHKVSGCEMTTTFRRMSEHFYGIPLTENLSEKYKYDLLNIYHVLEHMMAPDKKLEKYKSLLTETGHIMIATPYWGEVLMQMDGTPLVDDMRRNTPQKAFDELYHLNHIDAFSRPALKNLIKKCGLAIMKEDGNLCYGQTYLVKKAENKLEIEPEDWQVVTEKILKQKKAIELYCQGQFDKAVKEWQDFPEAWNLLIFRTYAKDPDRQQDLIMTLPPTMRKNYRVLICIAQWMEQREQFDDAIKLYERAFELRPNIEILFHLGQIMAQIGKPREAMNLFGKVAELHPTKWAECMDWVIINACKMPTWDEHALAMAKEELMKRAMKEKAIDLKEPEPVTSPNAA